MKKIFAILSTFAVLAACTKTEISEPSSKISEGTLVFTGSALQTKIAIGDKEGTAYKAIWEEGDVLSIVSAADASVLGTATLSEGAGENLATFVSNAAIADGTSVKLVYGSESLLAEQTQNDSNAKTLAGRDSAISEAITITNGSPMEFTLVHTPAIVKVTVSTTDFAALNLESVMLYSKGAALSSDGKDYINLTFANPSACSTAKEAWLTVLPTTESADIYAVAKFKGTYKGTSNTTVTIPVKYASKTLTGGKVIAIKMENLTEASCTEAWYNPVSTRYIGENWDMHYAYGETNTFHGVYSSTKNHSVKLVGDFIECFNAPKPAYVKIHYACNQNTSNKTNITLNGSNVQGSDIAIKDDYSVDVKLTKPGAYPSFAGRISLLDSEKNIIWSFNAWGGLSEIGEVTLPSGKIIADRNIGGSLRSEYSSTAPRLDYTGGSYFFQWGRPTGFCWSNNSGAAFTVDKATRFSMSSLSEAVGKYANHFLCYAADASTTDWWYPGSQIDDLWGNVYGNTIEDGTKSVFDPCPKGWKVMSTSVANEIVNGVTGYFTFSTSGASPYTDIALQSCGAEFQFNGILFGKQFDRSANTRSDMVTIWTDCQFAKNNRNSTMIFYRGASTGTLGTMRAEGLSSQGRANAANVRCMKDTDNR